MEVKVMKILMLEDEIYECNRFKNYVNSRFDIDLMTTDSVEDAINYINTSNIEGIIVDIELNNGIGESGLNFVEKLNSLNLNFRPITIVTTNITSKRIHNKAHELGVDMVFCKSKKDYCPEIIFSSFMALRSTLSQDIPLDLINKTNIETVNQYHKRIENKINSELDLIGLSYDFKGRQYIFEAIFYLLTDKSNDSYYLPYLVKKHKTGNSNISNAIQAAINNAWKHTPYEDLEKYYTARVSHIKGTPTPTEFIHYYTEKIKKQIS